MSDYAEPLLKIKAAIKELETALPQKEWIFSLQEALEIKNQADRLAAHCRGMGEL